MIIQVNTDNNVQGSAELTRQVEAVVEGALGRFGDRITRVEVHFSDERVIRRISDKDKRCVMEARFAGLPPITVNAHGGTLEQALNGAADTLEKTLKRTLQRKESLFNRRVRARSEFTSAAPLLQRGAETGDQEEFLARLRPLLGHLRDHARRELRMLETNDLLPSDQVTAADLLDEMTARAWLQFAERPQEIPLDLWLVNLLDETIDEKISPESRRKKSLDQRSREARSEDSLEVDDQEWWMWLLGEDEMSTLGDAISSGESSAAAEQLEARELKGRIHALLGAMPNAQRQAFVLHILEAFELFEVAMVQDRSEAEVQADIEDASNTIRKQLSADARSDATASTAAVAASSTEKS